VGFLSAVRQSLAGASVSVAVPFVAIAAAGVSPSFPGDSAANVAPAEAVRAAKHFFVAYLEMNAVSLLLFGLLTNYVDTGRYLLRGLILEIGER
jgi:hypothetical protein